MRFKRVLLITSPIHYGRHRMPYHPPAGLAYVAEFLKMNNIEYDFLDTYFYNKHKYIKYVKERIETFKPDLLGISMYTHQYKFGYELLAEIKSFFPDIKIVTGGPHVSTLREKVLEECKYIDYGVVLEGEITTLELCKGKDINSIGGLLYRVDSQIKFNGEREFIDDLDSVPFPKFEKFELRKYVEPKIPIISSRGCPFHCTFCPVSKTIGNKFRARSPENILEEFRYWYKKGYRLFSIEDDNFALDKKRVIELCELLQKSNMKNLNISCRNGIRADTVDEKLLAEMKKTGFRELAFGVEVGNDKMMKLIKKGENISTVDNAIRLACKYGFRVILYFIIGAPGETWSDFEDSIRLAQKYPVFSTSFFNLIPFPHTELYEYIKKNNLFIQSPKDYLNTASGILNDSVFITPEFSLEKRREAFDLGERIQRKVFKKYFKEKYKGLGLPLATFISNILTFEPFLNLYWNNWFFRKTVGKIKNYF